MSGSELPDLPDDVGRLIGPAVGWMRTSTWTDSRLYLDEHPELTTPPAREALKALAAISHAQGRDEEVKIVELHERLLEDIADTGGRAIYEGLELQQLVERLREMPDTGPDRNARIPLLERALAIVPREKLPQLWAGLQASLGAALAQSFDGDYRTLLQRAVTCFRAALQELHPETDALEWAEAKYNLATACVSLADLLPDEEMRVLAQREAVLADQAARTVEPNLFRNPKFQWAAQGVGHYLAERQQWQEADGFLTDALEAFEAIYAGHRTARDREWELGMTVELSSALAYAIVRSGAGDAALRAAEVLERTRARATSGTIQRRLALDYAAAHAPPDLHLELREATIELERTSLGGERPHTLAHPDQLSNIFESGADVDGKMADLEAAWAAGSRAQDRYDAAVRSVREVVPGFTAFSSPGTEPSVERAAEQLGPREGLAYVLHSDAGGAAILLRAGAEPVAMWDRELTTERVWALLEEHDKDSNPCGGLLPAQFGIGRLSVAVQQVAQRLGSADGILSQLARTCRSAEIERLAIVPCGMLGLVPLHAIAVPADAAGAPAEALIDVARLTYAPNATVWSVCRDRARRMAGKSLNGVIVGDPQPTPQGLKRLKGAAEEGRAVERLSGSLPDGGTELFEAGEATRDAVLGKLRASAGVLTHAHFACHAQADLREPKRTGLLLSGGERIALRDLQEPGAFEFAQLRLVVLSACQTGLLGADLPDEVMGLPAAWLEAGAAGVVASLWPVSDGATVALMTKFYELHVLDGVEPGEALWLAQRWLRALPSWRADFEAAGATHAAAGAEPDDSRGLASMLGFGKGGRSSRAAGWDDPVHWAAFAMYGA